MTEFEKVYTEYFNYVFLYIKGLSGSEQIAEDITAEAFFKAMKSLDGFNGKCMVLPDIESAKKWIEQTHDWFNIDDRICQILAIERISDHKVIGLVGIALKDNLHGEVEILYGVADEYQNNGYATEAGNAIINWAFANCRLDYLVAIVKLDNYASQRVIEKLGYRLIDQRELDYDGKPTLFNYYRLYRPL